MPGELLTRWTIRLALALYAAALAWRLTAPADGLERRGGALCWLWTLACAGLWLHIACAFHFYHHWSHASAVAATARETGELLGWEFGGGVYFNYLLAGAWAADVAWWWLAPESYQRRPQQLSWGLHLYLAFLVVNGALVFEAGPMRWAGLAIAAGLALLAVRRLAAAANSSRPEHASP